MAFEILRPKAGGCIRAVLFDMDGLVLDSEILYTRFWMEALQELGYNMTLSQALGMRSLNHDCGRAYIQSCFGPDADYEKARAIRIRRMDAWIAEHGVEPKKGIYELLDYLRERKLPSAIVSSSPPERIRAHLSPLGLYERFDAVCSGYEVKKGKPEPDIYLYAACRLGLSPECCLALEDSPAGIESAYLAGTMATLIPDRDKPSAETLEKCFAAADSLLDIPELIELIGSAE